MTKYRIAWERQVPWVPPLSEIMFGSELRNWKDPNILHIRRGIMDEILGGGASEASAPYDPQWAMQNAISAKVAHPPNMKEKLDLAVAQAEARLKDAQEAREIFNKHPELERLLNILQRNHF